MAESKPKQSGPSGPFRHLVGGEHDGRRHEPGHKVRASVPPSKIKEWLAAGIIEPIKEKK